MSELSWAALKRLVYERAEGCCEYCHTSEKNTGQTMHMEHIDPNGGNDPDNLCLSCANCNLSKAKSVSAADPETEEITALFNPRQQLWVNHFVWIDEGIRIKGLTSIGRATISRLKMNQEKIVIARARWVVGGHHPPKADLIE